MRFYLYLVLSLSCLWHIQLQAQTLNLGNDIQSCASTYTLNAGLGATNYVWSTGETTSSIQIATSGNYAVTATYPSGIESDTINVLLNTPLSLSPNNLSLCIGTHTINAAANILPNTKYLWYNANTNTPFHIGNTYTKNFTLDETFFIKALQMQDSFIAGYTSYVVNGNSNFVRASALNGDARGIVFDVLEPMLISSVEIPVQGGTVTGNLQIRDASNTVIYTQALNLVDGINTVEINYELPIGTGYKMLLANPNGPGSIHQGRLPDITYPRTSNGLRFTSGFLTNVNTTNFHCYFYNLKISKNYCTSNLSPLNIVVLPIPSISLNDNYFSCTGSVVLDATLPNSTYQWSTGENTASIILNNSGTVGLTVTTAGCSSSKNIALLINPQITINRADTSICEGMHTLSIQQAESDVRYLWFNEPNAIVPFQIQNSFTKHYTLDESYYLQGLRLIDSAIAGYTNPVVTANSPFVNVSSLNNDARGIVFDVLEAMKLVSVEIPVENGNVTGNLQIRNASNIILYEQAVSLTTGINIVNINYDIAIANGYRMVLANPAGTGRLHQARQPDITYPRTSNGLRFTSGFLTNVNTINFHCYFYNLKVSKQYCQTPKQVFKVSVRPAPILALDSVITLCAANATIDVAQANATYVWSNGETTSSIVLNSSQEISVTATLAGCTKADTTRLILGPTINIERPDTAFCRGEYTLSLLNPTSDATYLWFGNDTTIAPFQEGLSIRETYTNTKNYFIQGYRSMDSVTVGFSSLVTGGTSGFVGVNNFDPRGIVFTLAQTTHLYTVEVPLQNGALTGELQIRKANGDIIYRQSVSLVEGTNVLNIDKTLLPGVGYRLVLANPRGTGQLHIGNSATNLFPISAHGMTITSSLFSGVLNVRNHCYFYNLRISKHSCLTEKEDFLVEVLPTPLVNLGLDTLLCGIPTYTIDAQNTGSDFVWSTGETNQSITIDQSGLYSVTASIGQCFDEDSIEVFLLDTISGFQVTNQTFCAGEQTLSVNGPSNTNYLWMSQATGGTIVGMGQNLTLDFDSTQTLYVEAQNSLFNTYAGLMDNTLVNGMNSGFANIVDMNRGIAFTAHQASILKSVKIYIDGFLEATIELRTASGTVLQTKQITLSTGMHQIALNFTLPNLGDYVLALRNPRGGGRLFSDAPDGSNIYPLESQLVTLTGAMLNGNIVTSGTNRQIYSYFYEWNVVRLACPTARKPVTINILPTPIIPLPSDTVFCATNAMVSAEHPQNNNATYVWSTGLTSPNLYTMIAGAYSVTATIGQCTTAHDIYINISNPPTRVTVPNDTTICGGNLTLIATGNGFTQAWYAAELGNMPIAIGDTVNFHFDRDSTIWVESVNFLRRLATLGIENPAFGSGVYVNSSNVPVEAGMDFDVILPMRLDQVSLFVDEGAVDAKVILYDMYGLVLETKWVHLPNIGENTIDLGWILVPNNGYQIVLDSITGGKIFTQNTIFPLLYNEFRIQRGVPATMGNRYSYFYKWKISNLACATERMPFVVTVPPYPVVNIVSDIAACNNTNSINIPILSAPNSAYTYLWSTGATTDNIDVMQTGYYQVTISNNGVCNIVRDVYVQFLEAPTTVQVQDLNLCASQSVSLLQNAPQQIYQFYTNDVNQDILHLGAPYETFIQDDTSFVVNAFARATARVGLQNSLNAQMANNYAAYNIPNTFNVYSWVVFDSVAVYALQAPTTFDIVLKNNANEEIYRATHTIYTAQEKVFLPIHKTLAPSTNYQLEFANFNSSFLVDYAAVYPMQTANAEVVLTGTNLSGVTYPCFFDWHFSYADRACAAPNIDILDITVDFPAILPDTPVLVCDHLFLDVTNPLATSYEWSTGETSSTIIYTTAGLYTVTITGGQNCIVIDTIVIENPMPLMLPSGVNCGDTLFSNYTSLVNTTYTWSTGDFLPQLPLNGVLGNYSLTVTTPQGCVLVANTNITAIENIPNFDLGSTRILCEGYHLDIPQLGQGYQYQWSTGETTDFATISGSGVYAVTVTTANGCIAMDDVIVSSMLPPIPQVDLIYHQGREIGVRNNSQNYNYYYFDYGDASAYTTSGFHTYMADSCYLIQLIVQNTCGLAIDSLYVSIGDSICQVGIVENLPLVNAINFVILPNPNYGQFTVKWDEVILNETYITIYDANGRALYKEIVPPATQYLNFNLEGDMAAGLYFIQWQDAHTSKVQRFVILK